MLKTISRMKRLWTPLLLRIQWVFIAHPSYHLVEGKTKKLSFYDSIKTSLMCQIEKISITHKRKNISDSSESCGPIWIMIRLLEPFVLWLNAWLSPRVMVMAARANPYMIRLNAWLSLKVMILAARANSYMFGLTFGRAQGC